MLITFNRIFGQYQQAGYAILLLLMLAWQTTAFAKEHVQERGSAEADNHQAAGPKIADFKQQMSVLPEATMDSAKSTDKIANPQQAELDATHKTTELNALNAKEGKDQNSSQLDSVHKESGDTHNNEMSDENSLEKIKTELSELRQIVNTHNSDISAQKTLLDSYATGNFETMLDVSKQGEKLKTMSLSLENEQSQDQHLKGLGALWMLIAVVLISFMPLAFIQSESKGQSESTQHEFQNMPAVLLVITTVFLSYFILGFGLMFGTSAAGWIGVSSFVLGNDFSSQKISTLFDFSEFFLYQAGFAMLAALMIYKTLNKQLSLVELLGLALFVGGLFVPVFGHWLWASHYLAKNNGWLESVGFIDQGGSIIHTLAAWFILMLIWKLGGDKTQAATLDQAENEPVYSNAASVYLWLSTIGLTTASLSSFDSQIAATILNIGLVAAAAGLVAFLHSGSDLLEKARLSRASGGFVTGLVAASAVAPVLSSLEALVVGIIAGLIHNLSYAFLRQHFLPLASQIQVVYIVCIHAVGGVWGVLSVALFGADGLFSFPDFSQLLIQLLGIGIAVLYSSICAIGFCFCINLNQRRRQAIN